FEGVECWHAVSAHEFDLSSFIAVGEYANVTTAADRHAGSEGKLENSFLAFVVRAANRQGWNVGDAFLFHQTEYFQGAVISVLDRFDSTQRSAAHTFSRHRVSRNGAAAASRRFDHQTDFFFGECRSLLAV